MENTKEETELNRLRGCIHALGVGRRGAPVITFPAQLKGVLQPLCRRVHTKQESIPTQGQRAGRERRNGLPCLTGRHVFTPLLAPLRTRAPPLHVGLVSHSEVDVFSKNRHVVLLG